MYNTYIIGFKVIFNGIYKLFKYKFEEGFNYDAFIEKITLKEQILS